MRHLSALLVVGAVAWMPAARGSECFAIRDEDRRNACLAQLKGESWNCFKVQDEDRRNACLAAVKADRSYCFKIANEDLRKDCLGNTSR